MEILAVVSGILILGAAAGWLRCHREERHEKLPPEL
jgi:hypothetical protein